MSAEAGKAAVMGTPGSHVGFRRQELIMARFAVYQKSLAYAHTGPSFPCCSPCHFKQKLDDTTVFGHLSLQALYR